MQKDVESWAMVKPATNVHLMEKKEEKAKKEYYKEASKLAVKKTTKKMTKESILGNNPGRVTRR